MSCGKKRARKLWEKHQAPRTVKSSKYELEDPAVKQHWKNVIDELESPYKDEKFWETSGDEVHELVGDVIFERLRSIFNLPHKPIEHAGLKDSSSTIESTAEYYAKNTEKKDSTATRGAVRKLYSGSDLSISKEEPTKEVERESVWSVSSDDTDYQVSELRNTSTTKSLLKSARRFSRSSNVKIRSKGGLQAQESKSIYSSKTRSSKSMPSRTNACTEEASSGDDLVVQDGDWNIRRRRHIHNPYYHMLYCHDSETDMIKWDSNYKAKRNETSALDEFSKDIEMKTNKIATEFFEWWSNIGSKDYKSELKKPADIKDLFQVWFDEHASHALIRDRKILPCVLNSVAAHFGAFEKSQDKVLQKLILKDIKAESVPPETVAFNISLPNKMKHYPPQNNTAKIWHCVKIPEDLRTMECVWGDIRHLRSTKSFEKWLRHHPYLPLPPVFNTGVHPRVAYLAQDSASAEMDINLTIPFTQDKIEIKDVLSKLLE